MSELNYENLQGLIKAGNVDEVKSLLSVSNEEILKALGTDDRYDDLLDEAILSKNFEMVKVLFKHSNLINETPEGMKERLLEAQEWKNSDLMSDRDREAAETILGYIDQWARATGRANLQTYKGKHKEWQTELRKAKEMGFDDLADRIQRRLNFEEQGRLEKEGLRPEGINLNRWLNEEAWILNGMGCLEFDMYGQENREAIISSLSQMGIRGIPSEHIQKNGTYSDYKILVEAQDVAKLKQFFKENREDLEAIVTQDEDENSQEETKIKEIESKDKKMIENKKEEVVIPEVIDPVVPKKEEKREKNTVPKNEDIIDVEPIEKNHQEEENDIVPPESKEKNSTKPSTFRDLNTLLAQHQAGELRSILAGIHPTDARNQEILKKIYEEYEKRAGTDYDPKKHQDLNKLIQSEQDVLFANQIDNEVDDGVVAQVEMNKPESVKQQDGAEKSSFTEEDSDIPPVGVGGKVPVRDEENKKSEDPVSKTESFGEELSDLTPVRSPLVKGDNKASNWEKDSQGQMVFNLQGLTKEAKQQAFDILLSYGIMPRASEKDGEIDHFYVRQADIGALKKLWNYCGRYNTYNRDLLIETRPEVVEWNSPGMRKFWSRHHTKNMWFDNSPDVSSFNIKWKPYYLNIDGFDEDVVKATKKYLQDKGIKFSETNAAEDMQSAEKDENPIVKGQKVIVVEGNEEIKKLEDLWEATAKAPELANPPKGMLPNGMKTTEKDVVNPKKQQTENAPSEQEQVGKSSDPVSEVATDIAKGLGKQLKNIGGSFSDTLSKFTENTLGKSFNSPEEFGEEFLYQMMAFPIDWLKNYFDSIAKEEKKDPAKEAKSLAEENNKLLQELLKAQNTVPSSGMPVPPSAQSEKKSYTPDEHQQRVQDMRDYFNRPENAEKKEELKQKFAELLRNNPNEMKKAFEDMFPNAPYSFEDVVKTIDQNGLGQKQTNGFVQPEITGAEQPRLSPEMALLMQIRAELSDVKQELKNTKAELLEVKEELVATKAELADAKQQLAQEKAKNKNLEDEKAILWQKFSEREQEKAQPVKEQTKSENQPQTQSTSQLENPTPTGDNSDAQPPVPPSDKPKTSDSEKVVIRDLNTLLAQQQAGELRSILADIHPTDARNQEILKKIYEEYEKRAGANYDPEKHQDLNKLIQSKQDVLFANQINNVVADGYDKDTGIYKKTIELKDAVAQEKVLANRERLINLAHKDLETRRPDLFNQMNLAHDEKGKAVLSVGELKIQHNQENKRAPNDTDELKFSTKPESKLDEVYKRYNLSRKDIRDLRIILTYFEEKTKQVPQAGISMTKKGQSR